MTDDRLPQSYHWRGRLQCVVRARRVWDVHLRGTLDEPSRRADRPRGRVPCPALGAPRASGPWGLRDTRGGDRAQTPHPGRPPATVRPRRVADDRPAVLAARDTCGHAAALPGVSSGERRVPRVPARCPRPAALAQHPLLHAHTHPRATASHHRRGQARHRGQRAPPAGPWRTRGQAG